jgi:hypothetical protein
VVPARTKKPALLSGQTERSGVEKGYEEKRSNIWNQEVRTAWQDLVDTVIVPALIARFLAEQENANEDAAA